MSEQTPQIFVVDDDPEIRKLLARYIEGQSFRVLLASSCSELRARLAADRIDRPGHVLSRDQLLDLTRGREGDVLVRSIDVLVSRLKRKLDTSGTPRLFKTVRNGGYQPTAEVAFQDLPS